ncbi:hypothetical protein KDW_60700 [Dictyobacter vulcani]|uniref:Uncharacterized protein n=1 Tax=Dictyobacter vulcani TaxID=2607529 RepID=A0A5J4KQD5_9CHLR|nr:hypothetical protein KDW_60700 [Dictyobacter vulcani]
MSASMEVSEEQQAQFELEHAPFYRSLDGGGGAIAVAGCEIWRWSGD